MPSPYLRLDARVSAGCVGLLGMSHEASQIMSVSWVGSGVVDQPTSST